MRHTPPSFSRDWSPPKKDSLEERPSTWHATLVLAQLILLSQFHITIAGDGIDGCDVLNGEVKPKSSASSVEFHWLDSGDVAGHHTFGEFEVLKNSEPLG